MKRIPQKLSDKGVVGLVKHILQDKTECHPLPLPISSLHSLLSSFALYYFGLAFFLTPTPPHPFSGSLKYT